MADFELTGKVALVTGSSRGIGEAIAHEYARRGAKVIVSSRKQDACDEVARAIIAAGGEALPIACHAGKVSDIEALFARIQSEFGRLDVLVNNAATNPYFGPMIQASESAFDKTFEVNCKGFFFMAQQAARMMVEQGGGAIVNVSSIEGISPSP